MHDLGYAYLMIGLLAVTCMLLGGLLYAGSSVAPIAVRVLPEAGAARLLRAFWPRYYRTGAFVAMLLTLTLGVLAPWSPMGVHYSALLTGLAALLAVCLWLPLRMIPTLNHARDAGETRRFERLHHGVMALTGLAMLFGLALIVALGWVLPGQYLVWMH